MQDVLRRIGILLQLVRVSSIDQPIAVALGIDKSLNLYEQLVRCLVQLCSADLLGCH